MHREVSEQQLIDVVQSAVKAAMAAGAQWADAVASWGHTFSVSFERNTIRETEARLGGGVGVRAFFEGGTGMATANSLDPDTVAETAHAAAELARSASPDPDFKRLPDPQPLPEPPASFDDELAGLPAERLVEICTEAIERARAVRDNVFLAGGADVGVSTWAMASSTGITVTSRNSGVGVGFYASVWEDDRAASYVDGIGARRLADLTWQDMPAAVVRRAADLLDERPIPTGRYDVVLDFRSAYYWLAGIVHRCNAEDVQRERSFMAGKEGEAIAPGILTVTEDPFIDWGTASAAFDGEGVPKQKRNLIDRGVVTTYLHNSYTAGKAGVEPTGHAARGGSDPNVGIGTSNLLVQPGDKPLETLISEIENGLFIIMGAPTPNPVTGQVSETIDGGFVIRNGEIAHAVKGAMLVGEIFDILGRLDAVSSDYRTEPGAIMPAVRLRDIQVSGQ